MLIYYNITFQIFFIIIKLLKRIKKLFQEIYVFLNHISKGETFIQFESYELVNLPITKLNLRIL